jgi:hypothetical protein
MSPQKKAAARQHVGDQNLHRQIRKDRGKVAPFFHGWVMVLSANFAGSVWDRRLKAFLKKRSSGGTTKVAATSSRAVARFLGLSVHFFEL